MQACVQDIKNSQACLNMFPLRIHKNTTIINMGRRAFIYTSINTEQGSYIYHIHSLRGSFQDMKVSEIETANEDKG